MIKNRTAGILILSTINYPGYLGDSIRIPSLAHELTKTGYDVNLFITNFTVARDKELHEDGFGVHYVKMPFYPVQRRLKTSSNRSPLRRLFMAFLYVLTIFKLTIQLFEFCKRHEVDVLISYMPYRLTLIPTAVCKIVFRKPLIVDVADKYDCDPLERLFLRYSDSLTYITLPLKRELETVYGIKSEHLFYLPNGTDTEFFTKAESHVNPYPGGKKIVLFVGDIYTIDILVKAAPLIIKKNPNTLFIIVGNGKGLLWKSRIEQTELKDYFQFTGFVPHSEIPKYILHSDICVSTFTKSPYLTYALPLKLFEYMACGKPIVATNVAGTAEVIQNGYNGYLVDPDNPEEFADCINMLFTDLKTAKKMGLNGKTFVKKYTWEAISRVLDKEVNKLIMKTEKAV